MVKKVYLALLIASMAIGTPSVSGQETLNIPQQTFQKYLVMCRELGQTINLTPIKKQQRPVYDIVLSVDLQDYIWKQCQKYGFEYELILGLIETETNFNPNLVSYTGSSVGLMQINRNTYRWLADEVGIKSPNLYNPYHNIKMGMWYLDYLRQQWLDKGYSTQESTRRALLAYNRGYEGSKRFIAAHGTSRSEYTRKIYENKVKLERRSE